MIGRPRFLDTTPIMELKFLQMCGWNGLALEKISCKSLLEAGNTVFPRTANKYLRCHKITFVGCRNAEGKGKKNCVIVSICNREMFAFWWHLSYMNVCWKFLFFKEWRMIWITSHLLNMLLCGVYNLKINEQVGDLTMTIWKNIKLTMSSCSCFTGYQERMLGIFTRSNPENTD